MSYWKDYMIDQMELEHFVEEYRGIDINPETTRVMRCSKGRFERVYGAVHQYDDARQIFIPYTGINYIVEPAAASNKPVGYHGLSEADL
jgi:hypothetical protein